MTNVKSPTATQPSRGFATSALIAGLVALACFLFLFFTLGGFAPLILSGVLGAAGVVLGILALNRKQSRAFAVTGIVTGALSLVFGLGILIFALVFVGAIQVGF